MSVVLAPLYPLDGRVQHYAWGSRESLPGFLGRTPDGKPWAEWWLGAHPTAPSTVGSVPATTLDLLVAQDPAVMLGEDSRDRFGPRLPFLLKVLAVAEPLSLQVHPSVEQARDGYWRERPADSAAPAEPLYTDEWAKPEMLLALTRFDAFAGLRPPAAVLARLDALGGDVLADLAISLRRSPTTDAIAALVTTLLRLSAESRRQAVAEVAAGIERLTQAEAPEAAELSVSAYLAQRYPDDAAVVVSVLMNHVVLEPGEAMAVPAGLLHCYTRGLAVEIQGTSDNTLRAGLTPKRVDVDEVLRITDVTAQPHLVWPDEPASGLETFHPGAPDFALDRLCLASANQFRLSGGVPAIILAMDGTLTLHADGVTTELRRGDAVFVPAATGPVIVEGLGEAVRARPGTLERDQTQAEGAE